MRKIANVYKDRKRGTWFFSATLGQDRFGKRIQVTRRGFKTQGEARRGLEELKQSFSDSQGIYLQGITFHDFYREYFFPWYKLGTVEKTYMKTDHILQRALDFWRNAGCKDSTNSYTGISTVFIENPCCKKGH